MMTQLLKKIKQFIIALKQLILRNGLITFVYVIKEQDLTD